MSPGEFYGEARLAGRWPEPLFVNVEPLEAVLPHYQKGTAPWRGGLKNLVVSSL
jgi:hypothetical protein